MGKVHERSFGDRKLVSLKRSFHRIVPNAGLVILGLFASSATSSCSHAQQESRQEPHSERVGGPPGSRADRLERGVLARVGSELISESAVAEVARANRVPAREALDRLVADAVLATAAYSRGFDHDPRSAWLLTAARARITTTHIREGARNSGPPTDAEIDALSRLYWRDVDRPVTVRTVHALVQRPSKVTPEAEARARALAQVVHDAVANAANAEDFVAKANAVPREKKEQLVAQSLPAFAEDGRISEGEGAMNERFAQAAHALVAPGVTSGIIETPFGWHVIRLVERISEQRMPIEAKRLAFREEAYASRARALTAKVLDARNALAPVEVATSAEERMLSISRGQQVFSP